MADRLGLGPLMRDHFQAVTHLAFAHVKRVVAMFISLECLPSGVALATEMGARDAVSNRAAQTMGRTQGHPH